jgi:hypothetical protein
MPEDHLARRLTTKIPHVSHQDALMSGNPPTHRRPSPRSDERIAPLIGRMMAWLRVEDLVTQTAPLRELGRPAASLS